MMADNKNQIQLDMKKSTHVQLDVDTLAGVINGITIEDACPSPTANNSAREVIRVRWEDGSESIENVDHLYTLSK
jgi:hypothetical protein